MTEALRGGVAVLLEAVILQTKVGGRSSVLGWLAPGKEGRQGEYELGLPSQPCQLPGRGWMRKEINAWLEMSPEGSLSAQGFAHPQPGELSLQEDLSG